MNTVKTSDQVKADFHRAGMTFKQWAEDNGYPYNEVYRVVNGQSKAKYGRAHEIAVKLGLKLEASRPNNHAA